MNIDPSQLDPLTMPRLTSDPMTTTATIESLLADFRRLKDESDRLAELKSRVDADAAEVQAAVMRMMDAQGVEQARAAGVTATVRTKWRAKCDDWTALLAWAVESGNGHIVQRRLTDAKVMELVDGGIPLPSVLTVEQYRALDCRRVGGESSGG